MARSLKLRRTKALGMVVSDITNPFFSHMVRGAEDAALKYNYLLLTFNTDDRVEREKQVLSVLRARRVDGILLVVAAGTGRPSHIRETLRAGTPIVCLDRLSLRIRVDSVTVDNATAARECVKRLLALGHRSVAIITGSKALQTAREPLRGYQEAMQEAGITIDPELIREGDFRSESGYRLGRELLAYSDRPTAIFVPNAMMTLGLMKALEDLGLQCPRDIAVATFDDLPLTDAFRPHLTAADQPAYVIGYRGVELLIQRIETKRPDAPVEIRLLTELKIRESTTGYRPRAKLE